jgi:hypothetical protein
MPANRTCNVVSFANLKIFLKKNLVYNTCISIVIIVAISDLFLERERVATSMEDDINENCRHLPQTALFQ